MTKTTASKDRARSMKVKGILSRLRLPRLRRLNGEQGYSLVEVSLLVSFFGVRLLL